MPQTGQYVRGKDLLVVLPRQRMLSSALQRARSVCLYEHDAQSPAYVYLLRLVHVPMSQTLSFGLYEYKYTATQLVGEHRSEAHVAFQSSQCLTSSSLSMNEYMVTLLSLQLP